MSEAKFGTNRLRQDEAMRVRVDRSADTVYVNLRDPHQGQ